LAMLVSRRMYLLPLLALCVHVTTMVLVLLAVR